MLALRSIIEFNSQILPSPWNRGPPIPAPSYPRRVGNAPATNPSTSVSSLIDDIDVEVPPHEAGTPDLTHSPSSTISTVSLEDDGIKRIFSPSRFRLLELEGDGDPLLQRPQKEELNPHALPFVPSFLKYSGLHNPISNSLDTDFSYAPPPLDLDMQSLDFSTPYAVEALPTPLLNCPPHPRTVSLPPLYPPGLPHPPMYSTPTQDNPAPGPPCPPPQYLPVLLDALKPGRTTREREVLAGVIVNIADDWNMDSLLELAERIGMEACDPTADAPTVLEPPTPGADLSLLLGEEPNRPTKVAELASALKNHFDKHHADVGQFFRWNLAETVLTRFIHFWDCEKPKAIILGGRPAPGYVQSALTLSRSIAAFFRQGLISNSHISMCLSVLLKNLQSAEHIEAMSNLVMGCGRSFWEPANPEIPASADPQTGANGSLLMSTSNSDTTKMEVVKHVSTFLTGLHAILCAGRKLSDYESVLGYALEPRHVEETLLSMVDAVKYWEAEILSGRFALTFHR